MNARPETVQRYEERIVLGEELPRPADGTDAGSKRERRRSSGSIDLAIEFLTDCFTARDARTLLYWRSEFYTWRLSHYAKLPEDDLKARVKSWLYRRGEQHGVRNVNEGIAALQAVVNVEHDVEWPTWRTDARPRGTQISFRNTIAEFAADGTLIAQHDHTPDYLNLIGLRHDFDPTAACPAWLEFLDEVFSADAERIKTLQQWFGYLLSGSNHLQRILLLLGPPRAGKGVTLQMIRSLLGEGNVASPTLASLGGNFGLWPLLNKPVAIFGDATVTGRADGMGIAEVLKGISGGDRVDVHRKYLPTLSDVQLPTRFVLAANDLPSLHDASGALERRLSILPYDHSFVGREDPRLTQKLADEVAGVTNWALAGLRSIATEGRFTEPERAREIHHRYARLSAPAKAFVEDCCELVPDAETDKDDLFAAYRHWCGDQGRNPTHKDRFSEQILSAFPGIRIVRPRRDGRRPRLYSGLRLDQQMDDRFGGGS